jgi:uncharacterized protein YkwD
MGLLSKRAARVAILTAALAVPAGAHADVGAANALERPIVDRINVVRRSHGLRPLAVSFGLARAGNAHSVAMGRGGFFSHDSADGTPFWRRVQRYYPSAGYSTWAVGENLLWSSGDLTARRTVRMWMRSPGHRAVLLSRRWRQVGIGAVRATNAPGVYGGLDVTIVTADFGVRS